MLLGQYRTRQPRQQSSSRTSSEQAAAPGNSGSGHTRQTHSRQNSGFSALDRFRPSAREESHNSPLTDEFDESISQIVGRRRQRTDSSTAELTEEDRKRLKLEARELTRVNKLSSTKPLMQLAEARTTASMLLIVGAWVLQLKEQKDEDEDSDEAICAYLMSKTFEAALRSRLTVCLLSPNITAYVLDTQTNIMSFIKANLALFKVPELVFERDQPCILLNKMVSKDLATARGNFKTSIAESIFKRKNIMDTFQSVVGTKSVIGMEITPSNWTRFAFLRRCYREFHIGITTDKNTISALFSMYLLPGLHSDLRDRVESVLGIDLDKLEEELTEKLELMQNDDENEERPQGVNDDGDGAEETGGQRYDDSHWERGSNDGSAHARHNDDQDADVDEGSDLDGRPNEGPQAPSSNPKNTSGFLPERDGCLPTYVDGRYWRYVDHSLQRLLNQARERAGGRGSEVEEKLYLETLSEIFMLDLHEFPGRRHLDKNFIGTPPEWQQTIERELVWTAACP